MTPTTGANISRGPTATPTAPEPPLAPPPPPAWSTWAEEGWPRG
eukprot:CAMPEP_0181233458 /NCGR_PEP_ID=MMETSP1096-20121128/36346_1 /TAXON_ID=156174 ORGANISM="Chrysochromulina ericina, Strain CCMP281" /NCGR_SAMPLE_ID=MMETSP1096 /ASSEMBLY_ACC=CAM_ASM_000453 /LENGTH=43 /DNA_ID= /DNA_START= /DNA_END= /DNA_ORIENTATION=